MNMNMNRIKKQTIYMLAAAVMLLATGSAVLAVDYSSIRIKQPKEDGIWIGDRKIVIEIRGMEAEELQTVSVYLDGMLLKELNQPPFKFTHNFGPSPKNRILEVLGRTRAGKQYRHSIKSFHTDDTHTVNVMQVVLPVTVTDRKGNYISGLKQSDFIIYEDGVAQDTSYFNSEGQSKFRLVLLVDISSSMKDKIAEVKEIAKIFLRQLLRPNDEAIIVFFNHDVFEDSDFTSDIDELDKSLSIAFPFGATALYDAVAYSVKVLKSHIGQNLVILFSDGEDNSSAIDPYTLMKMVERSNSVIYSIGKEMDGYNQYQDLLKKIANSSGGMPFFFNELTDIEKLYAKIRQDIQAKYVLQFSPKKGKPQNRYRKVAVKLTKAAEARIRKRCNIRTFKGYHY